MTVQPAPAPTEAPVSAAEPPPALGYRPALDGVRAIAVLLVVGHHAAELLVSEWSGRLMPGGFLGVDVFFVLSGFLITTLLLEEHGRRGQVSMRSFYARRALRLLPAVAVLLLAHAVVAVLAGADLGLEARTAAAVGLYSVNWVIVAGGSLAAGLGHLWSLSVEEQFYLLWPLFLVFALRRSRPVECIFAMAAAGIVWATAVRSWLWVDGAGWEAIYVRTDTRADELLMGTLLAVAVQRGWALPRRARLLGFAGLGLVVIFAAAVHRDDGWLYIGGGFTLVGLASVLLVAAALDRDAFLTRALSVGPAVHLGRASYSLYLWHVPVFVTVADLLAGRPAWERLVLGLAGCAAVTRASYRLVEVPIVRYRRRLASRGTMPLGEPGPTERPRPAAGPAHAPTGSDRLGTAVVVVNYRTPRLTRDAVASVLGEPGVVEVLVVDNASGDGSAESLRSAFADDRVRVVESDRNLGFGPAVNLAAAQTGAPLLLVLNSDATLTPGSLARLARTLVADERVGVVAPAVYEPDGLLQERVYGRLPRRRDIVLGRAWALDGNGAAPDWVSGVAMLLRRADFLAVGGFDESFEMYFEDLDLCLRLRRAGKVVRREPSAAVVHHGGRSWQSPREKKRRFHQSKLRYYEKLGVTGPERALVRAAGVLRTRMARPSR